MLLYAGDGISVKFTVQYPDSSPFPLDGVVSSWIKSKRTDPDPPLLEWTVDDTQQPNGIVLLSLTGDQTESLVNGKGVFAGVWDLQFLPTGAEAMTLAQGNVTCNADVTH